MADRALQPPVNAAELWRSASPLTERAVKGGGSVTDDGPYAITGGIDLIGLTFGEGASTEHYTLCRCGASKNKPFCDGSHWNVGFRDAAG